MLFRSANGVETCERVVEVRALDRKGTVHVLTNDEMGYAYRHSAASRDLIFTSAVFEGYPAEEAEIRAKMDEVQHHRETVQPIREKTGGSTFKNPEGHSSWKLVDEAGWRGKLHIVNGGGAMFSELHSNFLTTPGAAPAAPVAPLGAGPPRAAERRGERSGVGVTWRVVVKRRPEPSAFPTGKTSAPGCRVRRRGSPPVADSTYSTKVAGYSAMKAITLPSGEKRGRAS